MLQGSKWRQLMFLLPVVCYLVLGLLPIAWLASAGPVGAAVTHIVLNGTVTCMQIAVVLIVTHPLAHA
jgi:hypothetical protein